MTLLAAVLNGGLFAAAVYGVTSHSSALTYDIRWHTWLIAHRVESLSYLARALTYLGSSPVVYAAVLGAAVLVARRRRYREAVLAVAALLIGQLIRLGISVLIHRSRPPHTDWLTAANGYAFPSGHTTSSVLGWGIVVALAWPWLRTPRQRISVVITAAVIAATVGASRAYLGVHWPTDVFAGWALGGFLLTVTVAVLSLQRLCSEPNVVGWGERPS